MPTNPLSPSITTPLKLLYLLWGTTTVVLYLSRNHYYHDWLYDLNHMKILIGWWAIINSASLLSFTLSNREVLGSHLGNHDNEIGIYIFHNILFLRLVKFFLLVRYVIGKKKKKNHKWVQESFSNVWDLILGYLIESSPKDVFKKFVFLRIFNSINIYIVFYIDSLQLSKKLIKMFKLY